MVPKVGYKDFERKSSLYFASYKKDVDLLKKEYALHKSLGLDIKYWDENKVKEKMGFSAPAHFIVIIPRKSMPISYATSFFSTVSRKD